MSFVFFSRCYIYVRHNMSCCAYICNNVTSFPQAPKCAWNNKILCLSQYLSKFMIITRAICGFKISIFLNVQAYHISDYKK